MSDKRKTSLTTRDIYALEKAIRACLPNSMLSCTYLVGTAQSGGEYRDVDVRTILSDTDFDELFVDPTMWSSWCFLVAEWLISKTGLPIDYQVQRQTEANERYNGPRNPIGTGRRGFAGYGDATPFDVYGQRQTLTPETEATDE